MMAAARGPAGLAAQVYRPSGGSQGWREGRCSLGVPLGSESLRVREEGSGHTQAEGRAAPLIGLIKALGVPAREARVDQFVCRFRPAPTRYLRPLVGKESRAEKELLYLALQARG